MSTQHFGYGSNAEYVAAVNAELAAMAPESKPASSTALAKESAPAKIARAEKLLEQVATDAEKSRSLESDWVELGQMLEGSVDPESAAIAVIVFAEAHPEYASHAVEAMGEAWGEVTTEAVLTETVSSLSEAQTEIDTGLEAEAFESFVGERSELLRAVADDIEQKHGRDVRTITAEMAAADDAMMQLGDPEAVTHLTGLAGIAKAGKKSLLVEQMMAGFDAEVEQRYAGRLHSDEDVAVHRAKQAAATAEIAGYDPGQAYEQAAVSTAKKLHAAANDTPFGPAFDAAFDAEAASFEKPAHSTSEAMEARDELEKLEAARDQEVEAAINRNQWPER